MRLTCPNCGAQYEVPDEVIPSEGRDVQCSNCGDTWYQAHPDHPLPDPHTESPDAPDDQGIGQDFEPEPEFASDTAPEPDWQDIDDDVDEPPYAQDDTDAAGPPPDHAPRSGLDPSVSDILREEAEREAALRASEAGSLESQGELGLDAGHDDESARRAREARDRMARMRGEEPAPAVNPADNGSRRGLLPDIEDINSTLRGGGNPGATENALGPVADIPQKKKNSSFARGFTVVLIFAVILLLIYAKAPQIAEAVPQADPTLGSYVALVDQARVWLDAQLGQYLPESPE